MNLFDSINFIKTLRDEYDLTIPQAKAVLIAYQFGTVSSDSAKFINDVQNAKTYASMGILRIPADRGVLEEIGLARTHKGTKRSKIYRLANRQKICDLLHSASVACMGTYRTLMEWEREAQRVLEVDHEGR